MRMNLLFLSLVSSILLLIGCNYSQPSGESAQPRQEMKTTRIHIDGFMKSKSGAI
jgi:hypothetical protein